MKQGVVHLQAARGEAVRRADEAEANLEERQDMEAALVTVHDKALQAVIVSKVSHTFLLGGCGL